MSEEYSVGYESGYQDGWNAAVEQAEQEPVATDMERADAYLKGYTDARRDSKDKSK